MRPSRAYSYGKAVSGDRLERTVFLRHFPDTTEPDSGHAVLYRDPSATITAPATCPGKQTASESHPVLSWKVNQEEKCIHYWDSCGSWRSSRSPRNLGSGNLFSWRWQPRAEADSRREFWVITALHISCQYSVVIGVKLPQTFLRSLLFTWIISLNVGILPVR